MLKIRNLEAGYGKLRVLKGISLHVSLGEIVIIIGANGAGKTTLLKTISGILKARAGSIHFEEQSIGLTGMEEIVNRVIATRNINATTRIAPPCLCFRVA